MSDTQQPHDGKAKELFERFFDSDEPVAIADLLAQCPEDERDRLRMAFTALDAAALFQEAPGQVSDTEVARGQKRLVWLRRREAVRSLWSAPPAPETTRQHDAARTLLARNSGLGSLLSRDPVNAMARALGLPAGALALARQEGGPSSRLAPTNEPLAQKERWIGDEAEALLRAADALYAPIPQQFGKVERYLSLLAEEADLQDRRLEGCLVTDGKCGGIVVNTSVRYGPRRSFTRAHEIGHFILHRPLAADIFRDGEEDLSNFRDGLECEANLFASALLIPPSLLRRFYTPSVVPRLTQVNSLVSALAVSPLAAMYRLVRATEHPCLLAVFQDGFLSWHISSEAFEGAALAKGTPLPAGSTAELFGRTPGDSRSGFHQAGTPAERWIQAGPYSTADESTFKVNSRYIYSLVTFHR